MKYCSFQSGDGTHIGALTERGVVDLGALGFPDSMNEFIAAGDDVHRRAAEAANDPGNPALAADSLTFAPVTRPFKIICEGLNYRQHAEETGGEAPKYPIFFSKFNDCLTPAGAPVKLPAWLSHYDYEAELVIVIGRRTHNVTAAEAPNYIFGYTCGNDLSARDAQFLSTQWLIGKALPGFAPAGPFIVTRDAFDPNESHGISCVVNGRTVQSAATSDMIFNCAVTLSEASKYFVLEPGDLIFTGTPAGVIQGRPRAERVWLKPGDVVTVRIDGVGELTTPLV